MVMVARRAIARRVSFNQRLFFRSNRVELDYRTTAGPIQYTIQYTSVQSTPTLACSKGKIRLFSTRITQHFVKARQQRHG